MRAEAGVTINGLVRWTIGRGLAGLEAWAGTPGTVGGAIYGNAHFGGRNIGDLVTRLSLVTRRGASGDGVSRRHGVRLRHQPAEAHGRGRWSGRSSPSPPAYPRRSGKRRASRLRYRKRTQPLAMPSAGCIFQNPDPATRSGARRHSRRRQGRSSIARGSKGHRIGGARISSDAREFHRQRRPRRRRATSGRSSSSRVAPCASGLASSCATRVVCMGTF